MFPTRRLLVNPQSTARSYYLPDQRQGASLIRARKPYLIKNAVTGLSIFAFAASVYVYTLKAVSQDDFEDVPIPDAPAQSPKTPNVGTVTATDRTTTR